MKHDAPFDPKLKELINELEPIFEKYDAMAFVNVCSRTHGEFRLYFPKWSVAQLEMCGSNQGIRFKSKKDEQTHAETEDTVFGLLSIRDMCARVFQWTEQLKKVLDKHMEIDHIPQPITPHGEN